MNALHTLATLALLGLGAPALAATPDDAASVDATEAPVLHRTRPSEHSGGTRGGSPASSSSASRPGGGAPAPHASTSGSRPSSSAGSRPSSSAGSRPSSSAASRPGGPPAHANSSGSRPPAGRPAAIPGPRPPPPPAHVRPSAGRPVVVQGPVRPAPRTVVVAAPRRQPVRPYHGVIVYGPRPATHVVYAQQPAAPVQQSHMPTRHVDRTGSMAVGLKMGTFVSGYQGASPYADFGMGASFRYRPVEALGLELSLSHHNQDFTSTSQRAQTLIAPSAELFFVPWGRVSPYLLGGLTFNARSANDDILLDDGSVVTASSRGVLWGPHGGAGVEFAIGQTFALDLEARYTGFVNTKADQLAAPGALQATAGLVAHF